MARQFTTGTISQPDAGSVGLAMAEKIRDDVIAHAAWELVEEFTAAAGTVRWYIFKCLSTDNGLGQDFFVVMGRTLSTGELRFSMCESYTTAGHMMQFYTPNGSGSSARAYDASGRYANTYPCATAPFDTGTSSPAYRSWVPSGTSTKWWLIVSEDTFTVAFNGASNGWVQCGAFVPLTQLAWPLPLLLCGMSGTGSVADGFLTRNPAAANAAAAFMGALIVQGAGGASASAADYLGFRSDLRYNDKLQNNQRAVAEIGLSIASVAGQVDYATSIGSVIGKHKGVRVGASGSAPAGFAFGDAYALSGRLWVPYLPTDVRLWDTGVAAS